MKVKTTLKEILVLYGCLLLFIYLTIQSYRCGFYPVTYWFGPYILFLVECILYLHTYQIILDDKGILISKWFVLKTFIPWDQLREIQFKRPLFQTHRIYLYYSTPDKYKSIHFIKSVVGNTALMNEISAKSNLPLPDNYLKFQDKYDRTYRRKDILWGCLLIPFALYSLWIYRLSIPYGMTFKVDFHYFITIELLCILLSIKITGFGYRMTSRRILQTWCYLMAIGSFASFFHLVLLLGDGWNYACLSMFVTGLIIFTVLQFIPDDKVPIRKTITLMVVLFLILWLAPTFLIPRARIKEIPITQGYPDWISANLLTSYSATSIVFYDMNHDTLKWYPLSRDTTEYYTLSPNRKYSIYKTSSSDNKIKSLYLYDLSLHQSKLIYQQSNNPDMHINTYNCSWSPDSRYFLFHCEKNFGSLSTLDNRLMLYDLSAHTTYQVYQSKETIRGNKYTWSPDSKHYLFTTYTNARPPVNPDTKLFLCQLSQHTAYLVSRPYFDVGSLRWSTDSEYYYVTHENRLSKHSTVTTTLFRNTIQFDHHQQPVMTSAVIEKRWTGDVSIWRLNRNYLFISAVNEKGKSSIYHFSSHKEIQFPGYLNINQVHPDKDLALYVEDTHGKSTLYEVDLATAQQRKIVKEREKIFGFEYSSDGKRILYNIGFLSGCCITVKTDGTDWRKIGGTYFPEVGMELGNLCQWNPYKNQLFYCQIAERFLLDNNRMKAYIVDFPE